MIAVTYCSRDKSPAPGLLPAAARYLSSRIRKVQALAAREGCEFRILSGKYGLLRPSEPIPYYDHLLCPGEVAALVQRVAEQLASQPSRDLRYYTRQSDTEAAVRPYLSVMEQACLAVGARLSVVVIEGTAEMDQHMSVFVLAGQCRDRMLLDRGAGETAFRELLERHPGDGILYLRRAEAYEALADWMAAASDYQRAEVLLWRDDYKQRARAGAARVGERLAQQQQVVAEAVPQRQEEVDRRRLEDMFQAILHLLDQVDKSSRTHEPLSARIERLKALGTLPRDTASYLHTIREHRNLAVKEQQSFAGAGAVALLAAWSAVVEWARSNGIEIADK